MLTTYQEVAIKNKLDTRTAERFVYYMKHRWQETETQKCRDGYAEQWAQRFKNKCEMSYSDSVGQAILKQMQIMGL